MRQFRRDSQAAKSGRKMQIQKTTFQTAKYPIFMLLFFAWPFDYAANLGNVIKIVGIFKTGNRLEEMQNEKR